MLGFIVGTMCLVGLVKTLRHGACGGYGHGYGHGGCGGGHGCGSRRRFGGGWGPGHGHEGEGGPDGWGRGRWNDGSALRMLLRPLFERLVTTPGQERAILEAAEALRSKMAATRDALHATRAGVATAFRAEHFDEAVMGETFAKQDESLEVAQKALFEALQKVHDALDPAQRAAFADHFERLAGGFGRWGHGPYRA